MSRERRAGRDFFSRDDDDDRIGGGGRKGVLLQGGVWEGRYVGGGRVWEGLMRPGLGGDV